MTVLVVAAHPDDEVLGCGGTMARFAQEKNDVYILILGEGMTSRYDKADTPSDKLKTLHGQADAAGRMLGAKSVTIGTFPDNSFDTVPLLHIIKVIEDAIARLKPETVLTQHGGDLNIDHERTFRAVLTATRPMSGSPVKRVYAYEVPSSTEWAFQTFAPAFRPNTFIDISTTLEKKIEAMALYESESRAFPHPRSAQSLRAHAQYWGSVAGLEAAEAFELIREIR
ncbi:MAG TPA: GlcNAc-PI de-N-acetylase [Candidatus Peribacter riflensis]|uniref:LmbE-like protein n=1 Tax=Candidatus Peribacter riflensis TaxID=1735162 RepID=A0A0S1SS54_9BACT|nr:MAG: LmbE-like protein [Candidatus Peribacter riflensis]OGJ78485.1 MAG: GlcNAc-PI de-N-acetylase [Candidatus Peribacteria bacterium RIFOXYB1_FULL_57_12]OGJ82271.1 MAG: GlcNAc-PI de-N-acetylase [Candidatus Peribacteria bacterium RIFOXYC1_FULL_58_8]ALM11426.1 MAG: LmbE-like protein [Candidatus Peribacter riflensis]ALM12528.1 MAG: LmbE-like protein [Candidatus Peribacter riflensis]